MAMPNDASNGTAGPVSGQPVVLRPCNKSPWQVFISVGSDNRGAGSGAYWENAADIAYSPKNPDAPMALTDTHRSGSGEQQTAYPPVGQSNQYWTADYSQP